MRRRSRTCVTLSLAFAALAWGPPVSAASAPLACRHAKTTIEHAICASPEYVAMDHEITALYDRGLAVSSGDAHHLLIDRQRAFLHKREGCAWAAHHSAHPGPATDECIRATMDARVAALRRFVDSGGK